MAKAGVLALTKSTAQEYAKDGIRVNALVAGAFDTDMLRNAVAQTTGNEQMNSCVAQGRIRHLTSPAPLNCTRVMTG